MFSGQVQLGFDHHARIDRVYQDRPAARASSDHCDTFGGAIEPADGKRIRARL
jgi:hypothetical protein